MDIYVCIQYKYLFSLLSLATDFIEEEHRREGSMGKTRQPSVEKEQGKGKYAESIHLFIGP